MPGKMGRNTGLWLVAVLVASLMGGCAGVAPNPPPLEPVAVESDRAERGWWYVRFIRDLPEDSNEEPAWYLDLLIANEIVAPVLYRHEANLSLWRFHRRAGHDPQGHAMSFIIYATPETAEAVYADIRSAPLLDSLTASGRVDRVTYDDTADIKRPAPEGVSDKVWSIEIQKAWPYFIMGVSRTWLDLVSQKADEFGRMKTPARLPDLEPLYRQVNESVDAIWREEGRHAFLHHLNAVFGYQPLVIYEKKLQTF